MGRYLRTLSERETPLHGVFSAPGPNFCSSIDALYLCALGSRDMGIR